MRVPLPRALTARQTSRLPFTFIFERHIHTSTPKMVQYVTGEELVEIIRSDKVPSKDYLIVDVRDADYRGGNIKGSFHLPSEKFEQNVQGLVSKTKDVPLVIFHCALSQARGPKAARDYENIRNAADGVSPAEVYILRGGFTQWQRRYKDHADLVENYDAAVWKYY
ncbi:Rhodanese-like protein [Coniophora puteana RWD-64-598 SS2]|uniref:Rhodanese-like protein n=1 Tax=Coniophora puteana (strain RWD-64-598) TaxID=741705 RepID=A0A5M3MPB3_CONPW|nr:Rhodanese-like protein [Coniophora puteana RWD-64-598 SS2]EIW80887.1 Rhodanese-like protein [Coniophora puteana RWD-64-598 SS2]